MDVGFSLRRGRSGNDRSNQIDQISVSRKSIPGQIQPVSSLRRRITFLLREKTRGGGGGDTQWTRATSSQVNSFLPGLLVLLFVKLSQLLLTGWRETDSSSHRWNCHRDESLFSLSTDRWNSPFFRRPSSSINPRRHSTSFTDVFLRRILPRRMPQLVAPARFSNYMYTRLPLSLSLSFSRFPIDFFPKDPLFRGRDVQLYRFWSRMNCY